MFDSRASQNYVPVSNALPSASNAVHPYAYRVGYTPPSSNSQQGPSQHQQIQLNHQYAFILVLCFSLVM